MNFISVEPLIITENPVVLSGFTSLPPVPLTSFVTMAPAVPTAPLQAMSLSVLVPQSTNFDATIVSPTYPGLWF